MAVTENKRSLPSGATHHNLNRKAPQLQTRTKPNLKKRQRLPASLRLIVTKRGKTTSAAIPDAPSTALKKPKAKPSTTSNSSPWANTTALTSPSRTRPPCTSSSSPASPWKPTTLTGRPATGVPSNAGRTSAAPHSIPEVPTPELKRRPVSAVRLSFWCLVLSRIFRTLQFLLRFLRSSVFQRFWGFDLRSSVRSAVCFCLRVFSP